MTPFASTRRRARIVHGLLPLMLGVLVTSSAAAIEFHVLGPTSATILPGGSFTIDIALENASQTPTRAVIGEITGLSAAGADVTSGRSARYGHLFSGCFVSTCVGGLITYNSGFWYAGDLTYAFYPGEDWVRIINTIPRFDTIDGTGEFDPGLTDVIGQSDPRDVTITMTASILGTHVLTIGGIYATADEFVSESITATATFTIHVVPEPSAALLTSLGLMLLAQGRRRVPLDREGADG